MPEPEKASFSDRLHHRRLHHRQRHIVYRVLFGLVGALLTVVGVAMLVLPGPAFVVIPVGLGMLALEFAWAERLLVKALAQASKAKEKVKSGGNGKWILVGAVLVAAAAGVTAAVLLEVAPEDLIGPPIWK